MTVIDFAVLDLRLVELIQASALMSSGTGKPESGWESTAPAASLSSSCFAPDQ
jgi:hypothetical protein